LLTNSLFTRGIHSTTRAHKYDPCRMKVPAPAEQFVIDADGNRLGFLLDLKTYECLRDAEEELGDIRAFDTAWPQAQADLKSAKTISLSEYKAKPGSKRK
jgi:hypothetical protein